MFDLDQLVKFFHIWDTRKGLIFFLIIWAIFSLYLLPQFVKFITENFTSYLHLNYKLFIIISFFGYFIYYLTWKYRRSFGFLSNNINVIFAIFNADQSGAVDRVITNLRNRLEEKINNFNLKNRILLHFKPKDLLIKSKEEAEKIVQEGYVGSTLIIWGRAYQFQNEIKCPNLNFTYLFAFKRYYKDLPDDFYKKIVNKPIKNSIDSLKWNISLNFSYCFEEYVINTTEIIMFILGQILITVRKYTKALEILSRLYDSFQNFNLLEQRKRGRLIAETKERLIKLYNFFSFNYYLENNIPEMEKYCSEALILDKYNYSANLSAAICEEEKGKREKAKEFTRIAEGNAIKNTNTHRFNLAYFSLDEGNFPEAVSQYNFLIQYDADFEPIIVADYLHKKYIETKKIEFLFGEGLIKIHWFNKPNDGEQTMKEFLKEASKNKQLKDKYSILIEKGRSMI